MKTILFQGDSITDCGRLRNNSSNIFVRLCSSLQKKTPLGNGYPALVADALGKANPDKYTFINRGVSGDRIPDVYARIVRDVIGIKPDYMSLLVGVNDVWHGFDWDNGTGVERFEKVYNIFLEEMKQYLPDTKIIILAPFVLEGNATANRADQSERYKKFRQGVEEMAAIEKRLAEKHGVKFVELQSLFDEAAKTTPPSELLSDGVHPTAKGHEIIKNAWIKAFEEICK